MAVEFGPKSHPVLLDPFRTIVKVQWGGGLFVLINMTSNKGSRWGLTLDAEGVRFPPRAHEAEQNAAAGLAAAEAELQSAQNLATAAEVDLAARTKTHEQEMAAYLAAYGAAGVRAPMLVATQPSPDATQEQKDAWLAQQQQLAANDQANYDAFVERMNTSKAAMDAARQQEKDAKALSETLAKAVKQKRDAVRDKENALTDAHAQTKLALSGATPGDITKAAEAAMVLTQGGGTGEDNYRGFWIVNVDKVIEKAPGAQTIKMELRKHSEKPQIVKRWNPYAKIVSSRYFNAGLTWWVAPPASLEPWKFPTMKPPSWTMFDPTYFYNGMIQKVNPPQTIEIAGGGGPTSNSTLADMVAAGAPASYANPYPDPAFDRWTFLGSTYEGADEEIEVERPGSGGELTLVTDTYSSFGPPAISRKAVLTVSGDAASGVQVSSDGDDVGWSVGIGAPASQGGLISTSDVPTSAD